MSSVFHALGVSFDLEPKGEDVLLTVIHRRLPDGAAIDVRCRLAQADILAARATGRQLA